MSTTCSEDNSRGTSLWLAFGVAQNNEDDSMSDDEPVEVVCDGCGVTFVLSTFARRRRDARSEAGEQSEPQYCSICRAERRQAKENDQRSDRSFTGDPSEYRSPMDVRMPEPTRRAEGRRGSSRGWHRTESGARGSGGERRSSGRQRRRGTGTGRRYLATCAKCGATTFVPFEPSKWQPVYCRGCYAELRGRTVRKNERQD